MGGDKIIQEGSIELGKRSPSSRDIAVISDIC
jgi:hypothetical protein